jgi:hypothetical protein
VRTRRRQARWQRKTPSNELIDSHPDLLTSMQVPKTVQLQLLIAFRP